MKKAAMNRKKRLDAPSKQEVRERYESARRQNAKEDANEERLSSTSELPKRPREDPGQDIQAQSSDLRDKLPKLSRTIAGNDETGSLVLKTDHSASLSLVDPSYDDNKMSVEMFDYSHKRSDTDPVEDDGDDLRTLIERQRRNETLSKKDDKHSKKTDSTFLDSMIGYSKDQSKSKTTEDYRDKRKENKDGKTSSGKSDRYTKHDGKSKSKKNKDKSMSSFELGFPFFSGDSGSKNAKNTDKPTEEMDINETLKELAYLRSIQTGDNALPKEEEEYFRKLNDLSKPILSSQLDQNITGTDAGKHRKKSFEKAEGGTKTLGENMSKIESKWDSVIDSMVSTKPVGNTTSSDEITYGPSLPPKKSTSTSKKVKDIDSPEKRFSKERSSSKSKSDQQLSPKSERGVRGGRGFRGRGVRGSFRGRGGGRGRGGKEFFPGMRGRGRSRGRFVRGGFVPSRGRHMFAKQGGSRRRSRSRSSSRSSSSSRSRSRSRSRGRSSTKRRRRRSSSRSSYSSSSYSSRSRSHSRDRGKGKKQTKKRSRSRSYSSRSRSRSRSRNRSRSYSRSTTHSKSCKRSKSRSRSKESYKKQNKGRARSRSRSKSSSTSRSRKRKDRSRSWSFDEDYTKKKNAKSTLNTSGTKTTDSKTRREEEPKIQSKPKKEKTEMVKAKPSKVFEPKLAQSNQVKGKTPVTIPENAPEKAYYERPKVENSNSPAVVALKDLKVTAFSNVFLPRTVSKTVGSISKGISMGKGRSLPLKKHPVFDNTEEDLQEESEKLDPKELERMKEEKHRFDKEVDKVFNAKADSKDVDKKKGGWKRVGPPEESLKEETQEQKKAELGETKYEEIEEKKAIEDQRIVESKETVEEKKTDKEQKKEKKGKRRKDKEERNKRKKEKKEKKEKKNKESTNQESLGNENKEKALGDDGQPVLDSSTPQQYNQEGYSGYDEATQEYPEGEYQYYEETAQEQGWYDENGVYHPYEEEEYLYYYDQEGNIVGYEGPEGYVEGNPFEEQQYYYEGETQEGVHPEVYEQEAYGTEYTGDAEGSYQYGAPDFPVEGQAVQPEQYTGADSQWEQYATDAPEQQWYNAEGAYPVEEQGYAEYQYAEGQEGANQYAGALEQQVPIQQDANYMVQQGGIPETYAAPVQAVEEPKTEGDLCENEIVLALGKNLAALARLKGWNQQELLEKDPINLVQMLQKPSVEKPGVEAHRETQPQEAREQFELERQLEIETNRQVIPERKPDKVPRQHPQERNLDEVRMHYPREGKPGINNSRAKPAEQKPLKSILKKRNSSSLKPPSKTETSAASPFKSDPCAATSDHVGPEYIVHISKSGPERFFCKLCQCHIESPMAKELHVKSMKHIELFVREKSSLLNSVIGTKQSEDTAMPNEIPESGDESGFSQQDKLAEKGEPSPDKKDYPERRDTPEEDPVRNRLLDYDRLRLMDWHRREGSVSSVESDKIKQFDHGRIEEQDFESRTPGVQMSVEQEGYEDKIEHSRRPRERREADLRKDEQGYGRERQHYAPEIRERDYETRDYHRERRSLSHDSDHRDDRGSVGSRSSDRSEKDSRLEHKVPPMAHRNRMQQDVRPSVRDRPGINQGEGSNNQRERVRGGTQREQPSRPEQVSGRDRSDRSRLNQNERERSRRDASGQGRGRTSFPPQENRGQAPQDRWHGQASRQDTTITKQDSDQKVQEVSSHPTGSSRMPSSDRKEMPRSESTGLGRERRAEQSVKPSERVSESSPVVERNQAQQSQNTSKDNDSNRKTATGLEVDRDPGRVGVKPLPRIQNQKLAQERRAQESQQQVPGSTAKPTSAALLGDAPRSQTEEQQPQEEVKSISTVIPGQRRVPPPPPPYNKGSGPQSFRGRGHPPPPRGRGGHHSHMPPNQPGIMGSDAPPHSFSMPPQVTSHEVGAPSSGVPPRKLFPGDQSMGNHPTPPFYGRGRAAGQQRGGGGIPHMSRGGYGGRPQFATRGRGGRGFRGQRW